MPRRAAAAILLLAAASCRRPHETPLRFDRAPVILISADTLRADHLPAFGYRGVATPALDRLRADSILYTDAWSHVPLTLPSHASILTGELPPSHGVRNNIGFRFDASRHETIASLLHARGYASGAAVSAYVLRASTGLGAAFDFYDDGIALRPGVAEGQLQRRGGETVAVATQWIAAHRETPFFFFLHLFEPHTPYEPTYDADVAAADRAVGSFLDALRARGVYDRALIVFLSDHGEGLGDHGEAEHGIFLYRESLHVPLMVKLPSQQRHGETVTAHAQLIDVFPTIAEAAGAPFDAATHRGASLLHLPSGRTSYAESLYPRIHLGWSALRSLASARWHFIDAPRPELYDAAHDQAERRDVAGDERRVVAAMRGEAAAFGSLDAAPLALDPAEAAKLKSLGYLSGTSGASGALPDPKDRIGDLQRMREAEGRAGRGELDAAIAQLRDVVSRNPHLTDALSLLGDVQRRAGAYDDAIASYARAIAQSPWLAPELALSIADAQIASGDYAGAEKSAMAVMTSNPSGARLAIARARLGAHDPAAALDAARAAMEDRATRPAASVAAAEALIAMQRFAEASSMLDAAARDGAAGVDFVRGDLLARTDRVDEAKAAFRRAIAASPGDRRAYGSLALLLWLEGDRAASDAVLDAYVRAVPTSAARAWADRTRRTLR